MVELISNRSIWEMKAGGSEVHGPGKIQARGTAQIWIPRICIYIFKAKLVAHACNLRMGGGDRRISGVHGSIVLDYVVNF